MNRGMILWSLLLPKWKPFKNDPVSGYTLLLPVPGDLPVFARLALDVCRQQAAEHRVATLLISDLPSGAIQSLVAAEKATWPGLEYLAPGPRLTPWLRKLNDPGRYHAVQLVLGVQRARSSHVILHDADAILLDRKFLDGQFEFARGNAVSALGVHPLWDTDLRLHRPDLVATWEMCARTGWLRGVPPYRHLAHEAPIDGRMHVLDTTVYAQLRTPKGELVLHGEDHQFVHFNYVVSSFRKLQAVGDGHFHDGEFRILLIRTLSDVLDAPADTTLPTSRKLRQSLGQEGAQITFPPANASGAAKFRRFRSTLTMALHDIYEHDQRVLQSLDELLSPFDAYYSTAN